MPLFKSKLVQEVWLEFNCHRCFQPDEAQRRLHGKDLQCPIQKRALDSGRKPVQWDRANRPTDMEHSYRCREFMARPKSTARQRVNEFDVPQDELFPVRPEPYSLVPVEGWPDRPRRDDGSGDHA